MSRCSPKKAIYHIHLHKYPYLGHLYLATYIDIQAIYTHIRATYIYIEAIYYISVDEYLYI